MGVYRATTEATIRAPLEFVRAFLSKDPAWGDDPAVLARKLREFDPLPPAGPGPSLRLRSKHGRSLVFGSRSQVATGWEWALSFGKPKAWFGPGRTQLGRVFKTETHRVELVSEGEVTRIRINVRTEKLREGNFDLTEAYSKLLQEALDRGMPKTVARIEASYRESAVHSTASSS